jgi:MarR family transcriptional regulator for hemolysin
MNPKATAHELDAPPWSRVESTLMATARLIRQAYDRRLAPLDVNLTQATVLAYLAEFGAATQTMIAGHLGQGRAATGVTIDRLHERGMVMRAADPVDRRVWIVRVQPRRAH